MLYRPQFCSECGEKIEKTDWGILDSRRFCAVCSSDKGKYDHVSRAIVGLGILGVVFGIGSALIGTNASGHVKGTKFNEQPAQIAAQPTLRPAKVIPKHTPALDAPQDPNTDGRSPLPPVNLRPQPNQLTSSELKRTTQPAYCGALTKKGSPCSRKVKQAGMRCFQHEGRPAAAEQE